MSYHDDEDDTALVEYREALEQTKKLPAPRPRRNTAMAFSADWTTKWFVTKKSLAKQLNKTCEVIGKAIGEVVRPELAKLEKRVAELEASPTKYVGVWTAGTKYPARSMVTHSGGIWHANEETMSKPGTSDAWTLAVKRGRDGRETTR